MVGGVASGDDLGFAVIVNASNPVESLSRSELSKHLLSRSPPGPTAIGSCPWIRQRVLRAAEILASRTQENPSPPLKSFWQSRSSPAPRFRRSRRASSADVATYVSQFPRSGGLCRGDTALREGKAVVSLPSGVRSFDSLSDFRTGRCVVLPDEVGARMLKNPAFLYKIWAIR